MVVNLCIKIQLLKYLEVLENTKFREGALYHLKILEVLENTKFREGALYHLKISRSVGKHQI